MNTPKFTSRLKFLLLAIVFTTVLIGCTGGEQLTEDEKSLQENLGEDHLQVQTIGKSIAVSNSGFSPSEIEVKAGDSFVMEIYSTEGTHNFNIDALGYATLEFDPSDITFLDITIPVSAKPGTEYQYYSSVGNDEQNGVVGVMKVVE